jgi:hypothetical protein
METDVKILELLAWELAKNQGHTTGTWQGKPELRTECRDLARLALKGLHESGIRVSVRSRSRVDSSLHDLITIAPRPAYELENDNADK